MVVTWQFSVRIMIHQSEKHNIHKTIFIFMNKTSGSYLALLKQKMTDHTNEEAMPQRTTVATHWAILINTKLGLKSHTFTTYVLQEGA